MTIKEKNLKLIMELIFIFILPLAVIGINCKLDNQYVYDNNGNFETSQKQLSYTGIDYNSHYLNIIDNFNLSNNVYEVGGIDYSNGNLNNNGNLRRSKYYNEYDSAKQLYLYNSYGVRVKIHYYDTDYNFILSQDSSGGLLSIVTTAKYFKISSNLASDLQYWYSGNEVNINYSVSWANGNYVPYGEQLIISSSTDISGQNNIINSPFVNFKNMVAGAFNVDNTDTSFNIIFDYTCLWFLQFVIWHLLYALFDFLIHLLSLKKKE